MEDNFAGALKGKKILVVEDTKSAFELIKLTLQTTGAVFERAAFGEEALQKHFEDSSFDLIIMDIKLPRMNGYEVTRRIREKDKTIPIIANTAYALMGEEEKAIEAGCNAYIPKPTNKDLLIKTVIRLILNP